jgi:hypothetical protein
MHKPYAIVPIKIGSPYVVHKYDDCPDVVYFKGQEIGRISKFNTAYCLQNTFKACKFTYAYQAAKYIAKWHKETKTPNE